MPDYDKLQKYVEGLYAKGQITKTFTTEGEQTPEQVLREVQNRTDKGYRIMDKYSAFVEEAQKRGKKLEGY